MGWSGVLQRGLLLIGWIVSAILLIRFAIDFSRSMQWWLTAPFLLLVIAALWLAGANSLNARFTRRDTSPPRVMHGILIGAIPLGFLASSLDCTGLSLRGCSPFCTFVKLVWIPLIAIVCFGYFRSGRQSLLSAVSAMIFVPLVPHCVCYNIGNAWWIDRVGASPVCYAWGLAVGVIAAEALRSKTKLGVSAVVCAAIIGGSAMFFVLHHYFQYPW